MITPVAWLKALRRSLIPHLFGDGTETKAERIIRRVRVGFVIAACLVTFQSVLLVVGAWRNDRQIERHMGVAAAEVLDAGPRRSTIEFVTPDRVTYRPELGVLYPSGHADLRRVRQDESRPGSRSGSRRVTVDHSRRVGCGGGLAGRGRGVDRVGPAAAQAGPSRAHDLGEPVVVVDVELLALVEVVGRRGARVDGVDLVEELEVGVLHVLRVDGGFT